MKLSTAQADKQFKAGQLPTVVLAYGDDGGEAQRLIQLAIQASGVVVDDPFLYERIDMAELVTESGRLLASAQTIGFGGGLKVIKIDGASSEMGAPAQAALTAAVKDCLASTLEDVLIVIAVPGLDAKTALVRAVEKAPNAAAIRCFYANAGDIKTVVLAAMSAAGKTAAPDAVAWLIENLTANRVITDSELEKLMLYTHGCDDITLEDCVAVVTGTSTINVFGLCDAVGMRDIKAVDKALNTLTESGEDLNMIFALVVRHLRRIAQAQEAVASGMAPQAALKTLSPPVMFNQHGFLAQMQRFPPARAAQVTEKALAAQVTARQGILPQDLVLARAVLSFSA